MENQTPTQQVKPLPPAPGAVATLIFGIISVSLWWIPFFIGPIVGIVFGIIARSKSKNVMKVYDENPTIYSKGSASLPKIGKILGLVGIIVSIVYAVIWLLVAIIFAGAASYNHMF
jgi:hypothetical protein